MHYQPKINLKTGEIIGAEALLRWTHPIRGSVPPAQFIPVAEDSGLILPIGNWVLRQACQQAQAWVTAGLCSTTLAVNISGAELRARISSPVCCGCQRHGPESQAAGAGADRKCSDEACRVH